MEEGLDLSCTFDRVWDTALTILKDAGWNITRADRATGGIEIHVAMDLMTWTETFYVNLIKTGNSSTRVVMGRIGLGQPLDWGIARQFIEQFLLKLQSSLQNANKAVTTSSP